jgi:serine phosphatase RsbU (regulator of sigma subunit)
MHIKPQDHEYIHTPKDHSASNQEDQDYISLAEAAEIRGDWKTAANYYRLGLEQRSVELALINSVQEGLSSKIEMQAIYDLVGDKLRDTFNAQVVMISQYKPDIDQIFHHFAIERGQHLQIPGWHPIDASRAKVIQSKKPVMINQQEINALLEEQKMKVVPGTEVPKSWLGVPMLIGNQARGIVSLQNLDKENAFSISDIELLTTLTNSMSQSLENARLFDETQDLLNRMEGEMGLARQAQKSILPTQLPFHPDYEFGSLIIPARAVGGDFFDFIPIDDHTLCIVIGDISDKGLPAALFMAVTFSLVRSETLRSVDQHEILTNINRFLIRMNAKMFVTLLYCILDYKTGTLKYSRLGHLPPILTGPEGNFTDIPLSKGLPLGVIDPISPDQQEITISPGGLALLFSDGLHEALDSKGKQFGLNRVRNKLFHLHKKTPNEICNGLWDAVEKHSGENLHQDDFTTVVIKRKGER